MIFPWNLNADSIVYLVGVKFWGMERIKQSGKGILENTIAEFKKRGEVSVDEIRQYLKQKYAVYVSTEALKNRLSSMK